MTNNINSYAHISTSTTTQVFSGACTLVAIVVNTTAAGSITVADSTSDVTPAIAVLKASVAEGTYMYNCTLGTGLRVITAGASDVTVIYRVH